MSQSRNARLEVVAGCMLSGKTHELIRRLKRARVTNRTTLVFTHMLDNRYATGKVTTHDGVAWDAIPLTKSVELYRHIDLENPPDVVAIDECQFFDAGLPGVVKDLIGHGITVIAAGLNTTYKQEPFGPMPVLMAVAEDLRLLSAICSVCHGDAHFTRRKTRTAAVSSIEPGGANLYEAVCREHYTLP